MSTQLLELRLDSFSKALSVPRLKDAPESAQSTASLRPIPHPWEYLLHISLAIKKTNLSDVQSSYSWGGDNSHSVRALCIIKTWTLCCQQRHRKVPLFGQFQRKVDVFLLMCLSEGCSCFVPVIRNPYVPSSTHFSYHFSRLTEGNISPHFLWTVHVDNSTAGLKAPNILTRYLLHEKLSSSKAVK